MAQIELQPARRGDAAAIAQLSRRLVEAGLDPAWTDRRIDEVRQNPDARVYVARRGQGIVGGAVLEFMGGAAHLSLLVVDPQVQRMGLGRRLMAECEHAARVAGCHRMDLEVREGNQSALTFYQRCGYRISHQRDGYYGPTESAVCLTRALG
jgi:ribosomal-protein-alanine N-acetyltransferase